MEEIEKVEPNTEKETKADIICNEETTPSEEIKEDESIVSIKFNKENRDISLTEAKNLAQKGLKYEQIESDFCRLKNMAKNSGKTVSEYLNALESEKANNRLNELIEQTGGNRELADYILKLESESRDNDNGFSELKGMFPEIKEIGELPKCVTDTARESGKNLLDCYLRYIYGEKLKAQEKNKQKKASRFSEVGSLKAGKLSDESAANLEFLKGLWGR